MKKSLSPSETLLGEFADHDRRARTLASLMKCRQCLMWNTRAQLANRSAFLRPCDQHGPESLVCEKCVERLRVRGETRFKGPLTDSEILEQQSVMLNAETGFVFLPNAVINETRGVGGLNDVHRGEMFEFTDAIVVLLHADLVARRGWEPFSRQPSPRTHQ